MKQNRPKHVIDVLFPMALFLTFALTALLVILYATGVYGKAVEASTRNDSSRTALSYLTEKIHQNDGSCSVMVTELDGEAALLLMTQLDGTSYTTRIYVSDGQLRELFSESALEVPASFGTAILPLKKLEIRQLSSDSLLLTCTAEDGKEASTVVALRSTQQEAAR